jgi:hypothetical protein
MVRGENEIIPSPPASVTATANSIVLYGPIAADAIGCLIPNISVILVFSVIFHHIIFPFDLGTIYKFLF